LAVRWMRFGAESDETPGRILPTSVVNPHSAGTILRAVQSLGQLLGVPSVFSRQRVGVNRECCHGRTES